MLQQPVSKVATSRQDQLSGSACGAGVRLRPPVIVFGKACPTRCESPPTTFCSDNNAVIYYKLSATFRVADEYSQPLFERW